MPSLTSSLASWPIAVALLPGQLVMPTPAGAVAETSGDLRCKSKNKHLCTKAASLLQAKAQTSMVDWSELEDEVEQQNGPAHPFCGIASNREQGNNFDVSDLRLAANRAGVERLWHYNWRTASRSSGSGVQYVPMVKFPGTGSDLPPAFRQEIGGIVKGWNEPDDKGQAGRDYDVLSLRDPRQLAQMWTADMKAAKAKGYTEFIGPAMAKDVCWLDHFLKACEQTSGCRDLVTYLALHRYRNDCGKYVADSSYIGWRDDLSYILSFYRLMLKYNRRGFNIKGLVWDELGCFTRDFSRFAPEQEQLRYMREWFDRTVVSVKLGDAAMERQIAGTSFIMPVAAGTADDADRNPTYTLGRCRAEQVANSGRDAIQALRSIVRMAWFSIQPQVNHLFASRGGQKTLSRLGEQYFRSCQRLPAPAAEPPSRIVCEEKNYWPDRKNGLICGECKVLVNRFNTVYGSCDAYCRKVNRRCVAAWEERDNTCAVAYDMTCGQSIASSDAICECGAWVPGPVVSAEPWPLRSQR